MTFGSKKQNSMTGSPPTYIVDANILIDLHVGDLLTVFFRLPFRLVAPDVVIAELEEPNGEMLVARGLERGALSGEQVLQVVQLRGRYRWISGQDTFALVLAQVLDATLLTGDHHLRQAADAERLAVHGTLWVLEEMVRLGVVPPRYAAQALQRMLAQGRRLPQNECHKRIRRWRT